VLLLFIINLIFSQRVLQASYPHWAWATWLSRAFKIYYASIVIVIIILIASAVQSFYTQSPSKQRTDHDIRLVGATHFAVSAFLPIPLLLLQLVIPKTNVENFGKGRIETKNAILLFSSFILTLGAAFRAGTAYVPKPRADPAWYLSKACFYIFNFTIEITVVALYAIVRVDQRFMLPDTGRSQRNSLTGFLKNVRLSWLGSVRSEKKVLGGEEDGVKEGQSTPRKPIYFYEIIIHGYGNGAVNGDVEKGAGFVETSATPEIGTVPEHDQSDLEKGEEYPSIASVILEAEPDRLHGDVKTNMEEENAADRELDHATKTDYADEGDDQNKSNLEKGKIVHVVRGTEPLNGEIETNMKEMAVGPELDRATEPEFTEREDKAPEEKSSILETEKPPASDPSPAEPFKELPFPIPTRASSRYSVISTNDPSGSSLEKGEDDAAETPAEAALEPGCEHEQDRPQTADTPAGKVPPDSDGGNEHELGHPNVVEGVQESKVGMPWWKVR
jgi:hypothetical protein